MLKPIAWFASCISLYCFPIRSHKVPPYKAEFSYSFAGDHLFSLTNPKRKMLTFLKSLIL